MTTCQWRRSPTRIAYFGPRATLLPPRVGAPAKEAPKRFTFKLGALYGHNFGESDKSDSSGKTQNDLAGAELTFDALPGDIVGLSLKQAILYGFNGEDDGINGRSVLSLGLTPLNLVVFGPSQRQFRWRLRPGLPGRLGRWARARFQCRAYRNRQLGPQGRL